MCFGRIVVVYNQTGSMFHPQRVSILIFYFTADLNPYLTESNHINNVNFTVLGLYTL